MFGKVLKFVSFGIVSSIFMTGCLLSSSVEQRVARNYDQMSASVEAQIAPENTETAQEAALVRNLIEQEKQTAERYKLLLIGVVIAVLVASALIVFTVTWYLLNRYWRPVDEKYVEVMTKGRTIRNPGVPPFANINANAMNANQPEPPRVQYARPPVRHYKVNAP